jgi:hypothetical protein
VYRVEAAELEWKLKATGRAETIEKLESEHPRQVRGVEVFGGG